ncbi:hypothetical protein L5515_008987 [Caenorhabditis briggsae]|uniref:Uncharacterized protein n=1 Tax=Caenorhabditis briggsae TaxID=6238 RepID=A0AAE9F7P5_CAEBR|nr:hypothetical protein L5515_008987 [Caenorhabditis briggsae]
MRFTDDAKPLLEASVDPTKEAPCGGMCQTNPDCYELDYIPGHCRFYQIETGKNLTFGFDNSCKGELLLLGIKVDLRPGEQCYEFLLLDLWESNRTRLLKNGKNYGLREVLESCHPQQINSHPAAEATAYLPADGTAGPAHLGFRDWKTASVGADGEKEILPNKQYPDTPPPPPISYSQQRRCMAQFNHSSLYFLYSN